MKSVLLSFFIFLPCQLSPNDAFSHRISQSMPKLFYAIGEVESKSGKNTKHKTLLNGDTAIGKWGLMRNAIMDCIKNNPKTFYKEKNLTFEQLKVKIINDPTLEEKIALTHFKHLQRIFKNNKNLIAYSWLKGETAAQIALAKNIDIKNHWYVQKINKAIFYAK